MENENNIMEIENDSSDVSSEEHETVVVDPAASPSGDQSAGADGGDPVTDQAASDHDGIGESSQDIGDGSESILSGTDQEDDTLVSDSDGDLFDGEDPLQIMEEVPVPVVIEMTDYSGQIYDIQQSLDGIQGDLDTFKDYLDMSQDNFLLISEGIADSVVLLGTVVFLTLFQFCFMRIRNAVRSFTGRSVDK